MRQAIILVLMLSVLSLRLNAQMKISSTISLIEICSGKITDWDHERAMISYNPASHALELTSDIFEAIDSRNTDHDDLIPQVDGKSLKTTTNLQISDLDFKTAADNGQSFTFDTQIFCNDHSYSTRVTYTFYYAPVVSQSDSATIGSFRLDFEITLEPEKLGLNLPEGCTVISLKITDGLINIVH
jgi:hypothetical protein